MYEGVIEGGENACYSKDVFTSKKRLACEPGGLSVAYLRELEDQEKYSLSQGAQPSSWAAFSQVKKKDKPTN